MSPRRVFVLPLLASAACGSGGTGNARSDATDASPPSSLATPSGTEVGVPSARASAVPFPPSAPRCEPDGCHFDETGACVVDTRPTGQRSHPPETTMSCVCNASDHTCQTTPIERIPCKSVRECWIDPAPRIHPVARPPALRTRDFEPCKDGEVEPTCGSDGFCGVGRAFKC